MSRIVSSIAPSTPALAVAAGATGIIVCIAISWPMYALAASGAVAGLGLQNLFRHLYH